MALSAWTDISHDENAEKQENKFEDIENNLRGTSIKDRVDYLNKITLNNDKNRFYIGD